MCYIGLSIGPVLQVDQLLEYHFEEDMMRLTQHCGKKLPGGGQTIIVSATLTEKVPVYVVDLGWLQCLCYCACTIDCFSVFHVYA